MSLFDVSITDEKDYLKIVKSGYTQVDADDATPDSDSTYPNDPDAPFGFAGSRIITHGLGYVPLVRVFWDPYHNNRWYSTSITNEDDPFDTGTPFFTNPWVKCIVTTTQLKIIGNCDGASPKLYIPVFYRIYEVGVHAVTTDRAIDKIVDKIQTSTSVSSAADPLFPTYKMLTIPHGMDEPPVYSLQFSEDQSNWYTQGTLIKGPPDLTSGPPGGPYATYYETTAAMCADATNAYITLQNNYGSSKTIYVRYTLEERE